MIPVFLAGSASSAPLVIDLNTRDVIPNALNTVNKWRSEFGLPFLTWERDLEDNAYMTGIAGNGQTQTHQLPPTNGAKQVGQVITPGNSNPRSDYGTMMPFEVAYLSWLCEVKTDPQTARLCPAVIKANAMSYCNDPSKCQDHHDILNDPTYKYVGCAFTPNPNADPNSPWNGLYVCSLRSD